MVLDRGAFFIPHKSCHAVDHSLIAPSEPTLALLETSEWGRGEGSVGLLCVASIDWQVGSLY